MFYRTGTNLMAALCLVVFSSHCGRQQAPREAAKKSFDPTKSDPQAIQVVNEMWQALGGKENWQQVRYLSYHWLAERESNIVVNYRHDWDRDTNRYRVEGTNRAGQHFVVLFNTQTKAGEVYLDGKKVQVDSTKTNMLDFAYGRFINDSYWLLMPYKLNDPGVTLTYEGEKAINANKYDVVKVTFENVGLTPEDTYWAFIDKTDHLMHKWEYVLQDREPPPTVVWWKDWQTFGGIKLALNKEFEGRPVRIYFENVKVSSAVDEDIFHLTSKTF